MRRFDFLAVLVGMVGLGMTAPGALGQWNAPNPVASFEKTAKGLEVQQKDGVLGLEVDAEDVLHVTYSPVSGAATIRPSDEVVVKKDWPVAAFEVSSMEKTITLSTAKLKAVIERESGAVHYVVTDEPGAAGTTATGMKWKLLTTDADRSLRPVEVNGEKTFHAEVNFGIYGSHEGFYGLGQHQAGVWNYRGETVDLSQENTNIAIPLLISTNGYGISGITRRGAWWTTGLYTPCI
jgi:alpha-D-xyloside xylohydrolase